MKNFKRFMLSMLVFLYALISAPIISYAEGETEVNLAVDECVGGSSFYKNGVSASRSFFLCYLLDTSGNAVSGTNAVLLKSSGASVITGSVFECSSRKGGYSATAINGIAPWLVTPFNSDSSSNAEAIRSWLRSCTLDTIGTASNAQVFIKSIWGTTNAQKFVDEDVVLVIETAFNFQPSYFYTYNVNPATLIHVPEPYKSAMLAKNGETFHRPFGDAVLGTVPNLIRYMQSNYAVQSARYPSVDFLPLASNNPFKSYTNGVMPQAEKIAYDMCGLRAYTGSGMMSNDDVLNYGVGMMVVTARDVPPTSTVTPVPASGYEGYFFSLSCSGMNGSYNVNGTFQGSLYAESSASGDDAYNLAQSLARGLSYMGAVPNVVFTGTNYDFGMETTASVRTGCVTLDAGTFYGISGISTVTESNYQTFAGSVTGGITRGIDLKTYDGSRLVTTYPYDDSSWDASGFLGGDYTSKTRELTKYATLTQSNSARSGDAPDWKDEYNFKLLMLDISKMYYNKNVGSESEGLGIWSASDLARAFNDSTSAYLSAVKSNGTLQTYWTNAMNADRDSKSNNAKNSAIVEYERLNPEPSVSDEPVRGSMTRTEFNALHDAWEAEVDVHDAWVSARTQAGADAYTSAYDSYDESAFTVNWNSGSQGGQTWRVNVYSQNPYYESGYMIYDKVPIRSGPSASASGVFKKAYAAKFFYTMQTSGVSDTSHLITYLPFARYSNTVIGECTSIDYLIKEAHVSETDFLIPDATSADMK